MNKFTQMFKVYLSNGNKYSPLTVESYVSDVELFFDYLNKEGLLMDQVDSLMIRNYICYELENGDVKRSVKRHMTSLRKFYTYMKNVGYVNCNPFLTATSPKADIKLPIFVDDDSMRRLIDSNKLRADFLASRDQAILEILYFSGIRAAELTSLKIQDVDLNRNLMKILGKGRKQRLVPFTSDCQKTLKRYLKECRPVLFSKCKKDPGPYVFLNIRGNRLTTRGLEYILNQIQEKNGMDLGLTPHVVRHSYATNLLSKGAPLMTVKELLGHDSAETTSIYMHVTEETVKRNYELLPRSKKQK